MWNTRWMHERSQQSSDTKGDGILNRPAWHYYYDDMHVKGNNSCEHPYFWNRSTNNGTSLTRNDMEQRGIYNGQSSMVVLESWGEMAQSVSSNRPSSRRKEREEERNGQHLLENIRNRWQLDHSKKWLVGEYLEGSSSMPCDETGTKTSTWCRTYNMPWDWHRRS